MLILTALYGSNAVLRCRFTVSYGPLRSTCGEFPSAQCIWQGNRRLRTSMTWCPIKKTSYVCFSYCKAFVALVSHGLVGRTEAVTQMRSTYTQRAYLCLQEVMAGYVDAVLFSITPIGFFVSQFQHALLQR